MPGLGVLLVLRLVHVGVLRESVIGLREMVMWLVLGGFMLVWVLLVLGVVGCEGLVGGDGFVCEVVGSVVGGCIVGNDFRIRLLAPCG